MTDESSFPDTSDSAERVLVEYVQHKPWCPVVKCNCNTERHDCLCGLEAALLAQQTERQQLHAEISRLKDERNRLRADLEQVQAERDELMRAVSAAGITVHKAVVALAKAHRQDSEDVDDYAARLEAQQTALTQVIAEMRWWSGAYYVAQSDKIANQMARWADRLATLTGAEASPTEQS
jgi:seryl-tRNA synthetase